MNIIKNNKIYPKSFIENKKKEDYNIIINFMKDYIKENNYDIVKDKKIIILEYYLRELYNLY